MVTSHVGVETRLRVVNFPFYFQVKLPTHPMASQFRVQIVGEEEIPQFVALMVPCFAEYSVERLVGNVDTPEAIKANTERHLRAAREHMEETGRHVAIKCTETITGQDKMVACAYWFVFDKPRSPENARRCNYLLGAEWLPEGERRQMALKALDPVAEKRRKWTAGRGHAILYVDRRVGH